MSQDFSNAVVYQLKCKDPSVTECYVGSTTDLCQRRRGHKTNCHNDKARSHNVPLYKFIRDNGGWDNWNMELVEAYPECASKEELLSHEREHIERLKASLNRAVPGRTHKEWCEDNREHILKYKQDHKEHIREYHRKYNQDRKEHMLEKIECEFCGLMRTRGNMPRHQRTQKCLAAQDAEL